MTAPRLLVTRPRPDADRTAERLRDIGITPVVSPLMRLAPLAADLPPPGEVAALALTSANAVRALDALGAGASYRHLPVFAIGPATAAAAREAGFEDVCIAAGTVAALAETIAERRTAGPVLYLAARYQSASLEALAAPLGVTVETRLVYEMRAADALAPEAEAGLAGGEIGGVLLYSRRSAAIFADLVAPLMPGLRQRLSALCISRTAAEPLRQQSFSRIALADDPTEQAMMDLAARFARQAAGG